MNDVETVTCAACGERTGGSARYCEACGHELATEPKPSCVSCGQPEVGEDGYCLSCGHKQPSERDHRIVVVDSIAAGTDRGRRHHQNEDAFAVARLGEGAAALVVCDGVSSTPGSASASLIAAEAALEHLVTTLDDRPDGQPDEETVEAALAEAVAAAQRSVVADGSADGHGEPYGAAAPSTTLVAAVALPGGGDTRLSVAWVGDSRAYWIPLAAIESVDGQDARLLSADHDQDGSLTRWIGADSVDPQPDIEHCTVSDAGVVLICSDGLWRYGAEPASMARLLSAATATVPTSATAGETAEATVAALLTAANEAGGHDNITVALWPVPSEGASSTLWPLTGHEGASSMDGVGSTASVERQRDAAADDGERGGAGT